ncbi:TAXI family TRAP transporter solute-binding subunit (plasmid) [Verrucomicrobiaceae bacterium 227]
MFFLRGFGTMVLATGQTGGTYTALGQGFAEFAEETETRFRLETLPSKGTPENLKLLESGRADFAIVQSGQASPDEVRVVAKLYSEVLHILVRNESAVESLSQLDGMKLCLGEVGSGSRVVSLPLLEHFGVDTSHEVPLAPDEALRQLREGEVDAVFLVSALHSASIREGVGGGALRFVNLGNVVSGLVARFPFLKETSVPAMTYQCPSRDEGAMPRSTVESVGVPSLLVCRKDVPAEVVYEVTKALFASRNKLSDLTPEAYQISEITSADLLPWSIHEGAQRYFRRREPGFLERYAEVMAFLMSLGAASWAIFGAVSRWSSRKKKNRIDEYYLEVAAVFLRLDEELSLKSLKEEKARLRSLRSRAFQDLAEERLKADDSFGIFQDQLALCLNDVRRREERVKMKP